MTWVYVAAAWLVLTVVFGSMAIALCRVASLADEQRELAFRDRDLLAEEPSMVVYRSSRAAS